MDFEEKDSETIQRDIEQKRLEIEREIEEKRRVVEEEIAAKRREMDIKLAQQREELDRRHAEQIEAMNRQVDAKELAARSEAEFKDGKEQVAAGTAAEGQQPVVCDKDLTADADQLMQDIEKRQSMVENPVINSVINELSEDELQKEGGNSLGDNNVSQTNALQEQEIKGDGGFIHFVKDIFGKKKTDEEIAADIAAEDAAQVAAEEQQETNKDEKDDNSENKENSNIIVQDFPDIDKTESTAKDTKKDEQIAITTGSVSNAESDSVAEILARLNADNYDSTNEKKTEQKDEVPQNEEYVKDQDKVEYKRPRRTRKIAWGRLIAIILAIILVVAIFFFGTVFVCKVLLHRGNVPVVYPSKDVVTTADKGNATGEKTTVPVLDERINLLVLGTDYGDSDAANDEPKRTDAMLLISFDPMHESVSVLSIPRDTRVVLPGHRDPQKINAAYAFGGVMMAKQTVANLLGVPVTHYALADWRAFSEVVDLIGGVDIFVEHDMKYDDPYADLHIDLKKGFQHLNGALAGQYVRYRSDELGDIGRAQRQQKFIKAAAEQLFTVGNVPKIPAVIRTVTNYMETDMNALTMLKAFNSVKIFGQDKIKTLTLSGDTFEDGDISYWVTDNAHIRKTLNELGVPTTK